MRQMSAQRTATNSLTVCGHQTKMAAATHIASAWMMGNLYFIING